MYDASIRDWSDRDKYKGSDAIIAKLPRTKLMITDVATILFRVLACEIRRRLRRAFVTGLAAAASTSDLESPEFKLEDAC